MKYFAIIFLAFLSVPAAEARVFDPVAKYENGEPVEILIVPGHDDASPGAVFRGQREADMSLMLAKKIAEELSSDPNMFVTVTRNDDGYIPPLATYLAENEKEIHDFIADAKRETERLIEKGNIDVPGGVRHNNASSEVAYNLYGINKWIADEQFDLVIHIHFNDDTSHWGDNPGEYGGFTIYVPDENLPNADKARPLASFIGAEMKKTFFPSNLPLEAERADENGLVPDFRLIALGSNRTLETPSILVEYSYIYEPHVVKELLPLTTDVMARATARGVFNYLSGTQAWPSLTYEWQKVLGVSTKPNPDVLAVQYALREAGFFPAKNLDRDDCPFSGIFGPCTQKAVKAFQRSRSLADDGLVGPQTAAALNSLFAF